METRAQTAEIYADITKSDFFKGLLVSACLAGLETIDTVDNSHHSFFGEMIKKLERRRDELDPSTNRMPRFFPETDGSYLDLGNALFCLQASGIVRSEGPLFSVVELIPSSPELKKRVMEKFTVSEQALLADLGNELMACSKAQRLF
ncbi:MAG TPA: hypothetical protein VMR76_03185 [Candidatus Saccharimonadia bacterium]|nr:hypothetical protein [Candidatus Saccharimonadia bacterium]